MEIYKAKLTPSDSEKRFQLALSRYTIEILCNNFTRPRLVLAGIEPKTVESKLINIMYGE